MPFLQPLLRYSTPPSGDAMCAAAKAFEKIKVQGRCDKFFVCHIVLFGSRIGDIKPPAMLVVSKNFF